jgi:hypothetical protein
LKPLHLRRLLLAAADRHCEFVCGAAPFILAFRKGVGTTGIELAVSSSALLVVIACVAVSCSFNKMGACPIMSVVGCSARVHLNSTFRDSTFI